MIAITWVISQSVLLKLRILILEKLISSSLKDFGYTDY